jgi:hypothetical protein
MKKFEYHVIESGTREIPPEQLNELGEVGWELVAMVPRATVPPEGRMADSHYLYFKREKE